MSTSGLGDRSLFTSLDTPHYLNHAALSPPSLPVQAACQQALHDFAARGVAAWLEWAEQRDRLRGKLARLIGADAGEIALVGNTTLGISAIALSMDWRPGERILCFRGEFPTNVTPWQRAAQRFGLQVEFADLEILRGDHDLAGLRAVLERGVRLVAISAVQFQTGLRMPLAQMTKLCHEYGAEIFVDGIQAVGSVPIDVHDLGIDYLAAGGHKWLMGLEGTGMLYVARRRLADLEPAIAGWLSHQDGATFLFEGAGHLRYDRPLQQDAEVFEVGVTNSIGFAAMEASVDLLLEIGVPRIYEHVQLLIDGLETGLRARGFRSARSPHTHERSCILALELPEPLVAAGIDLATFFAALTEQGVGCATPDGYLRLSPHWPNGVDQVEPVLAAFDTALASVRATD